MPTQPRFKTHVLRLLLALILLSAFVPIVSCSRSSPATAPCTDCGSGNVYWDTGVNRCRDHANGQFVKSCCCGH